MDTEQLQAWERAFLERLDDPARRGEAVAMASDPGLLAAAASEPAVAMMAVRAMSAIAWHDAEDARLVGQQLKGVIQDPDVNALFDRAALDIVASRAWEAAKRPGLPPELIDLLGRGAMPGQRQAMAERLQRALQERPQEILDQLQAAVYARRALQQAIERRLLDGVGEERRSSDKLAVRLRPRFVAEMQAAGKGTKWWAPPLLAVAAFLAGGTVGAIAGDGRSETFNVTVGLAMFAGIGAAWFFPERHQYKHKIRFRLLAVMARVGVTYEAVRGWIGWSPSRIFLWRFFPWFEGDAALRLAGLVATRAGVDAEP